MAKIKVLKGQIDIASSLVEDESEVDVVRDGEFRRTHITSADYEDDFQIAFDLVSVRDVVWDAYEFVKDNWPDIAAPETWKKVTKKLGELGSDVWDTVKEAKSENFLFESIEVEYGDAEEDAFVIGEAVFTGKIKMPSSGGMPIATIGGDADAMIAGMPGNGFLFPRHPDAVESTIDGWALAGSVLSGADLFAHLVTAAIAIDIPSLIDRLRSGLGNDDYSFDDFRRAWDAIFDDDDSQVRITVDSGNFKVSIDQDVDRATKRYVALQQAAEARKANYLLGQREFKERVRELLEESRERERRDQQMEEFMEEHSGGNENAGE